MTDTRHKPDLIGGEQRPGEVALPFDPARAAADAHLVFIGRIRTPWATRHDCPRNLRIARERGEGATIEVDPAFRPGLSGLDGHDHVVLLYWLDRARRDLIVQRPRHATGATGVFSLRSPVRPNPIGLATVRLLACDAAAGRLSVDAMDCIDGTPLLDIKPWLPTVDAVIDDAADGAAG